MKVADLEHFHNLLIAREQSLSTLLSPGASVGEGVTEKIRTLLKQIRDALTRIEEGSYGVCSVCHGEIENHHLEAQPVAQVCLDCLSDTEKAQLEYELLVAGKIHRALLPQVTPVIDGFDIAIESRASRSVGGDYYDFLPSPRGDKMRIVIADSMGKGIPAGLLMSNLQGILKVLSEITDSPSLLLSQLNRWLCHNIAVTKFASLACLELSLDSGSQTRLHYANAGHPAPLLFRQDGKLERLEPTGVVLGVDDAFTYDPRELHIAPGDLLVLYTDGVTEAENLDGGMYEEGRLLDYLKRKRSDSVTSLVSGLTDDILAFSGQKEFQDDFTVVALKKKEG
jgi:sigma-B regulation protein RsbU (phosphoserine phosphatase)